MLSNLTARNIQNKLNQLHAGLDSVAHLMGSLDKPAAEISHVQALPDTPNFRSYQTPYKSEISSDKRVQSFGIEEETVPEPAQKQLTAQKKRAPRKVFQAELSPILKKSPLLPLLPRQERALISQLPEAMQIKVLQDMHARLQKENPEMLADMRQTGEEARKHYQDPHTRVKLQNKVSIWRKMLNKSKSFLSSLRNIKNKFTIAHMKDKALEYFNIAVQKSYALIWNTFGNLIERWIGLEKFYQQDKYGNFLLGPDGEKVPKQYETDKQGNPVIKKNKQGKPLIDFRTGQPKYQEAFWPKFKNGTSGLAPMFAMIAINRAMQKSISLFEKMLFRPLVSRMLDIPLWKLSHNQYKRHLQQEMNRSLRFGKEEVLSPQFLAHEIAEHHRTDKSLWQKFKVNVRKKAGMAASSDIRSEDEAAETAERDQLELSIRSRMWEVYQPVIQELRSAKPAPTIEQQYSAALKSIATELASPVTAIAHNGIELIHGVLVLPATVYSYFFEEKREAEKQPWESYPDFDKDMNVMIDTLKQVDTQTREEHAVDSSVKILRFGQDPIPVAMLTRDGKIAHKSFGKTTIVTPHAQRALLHAQDELMEEFEDQLPYYSVPQADEYDTYIRRLVLPKMTGKLLYILPRNKVIYVGTKLGIPESDLKSLNDHALREKVAGLTHNKVGKLEKNVQTLLDLGSAITDLISQVESFARAERLAGNYVKLFDSIDKFIRTYNTVLRIFNLDNGRKHLDTLKEQVIHERRELKQALLREIERGNKSLQEFADTYEVDPFTSEHWALLAMATKKGGAYALPSLLRGKQVRHTPSFKTLTRDQLSTKFLTPIYERRAHQDSHNMEFFGEGSSAADDLAKKYENDTKNLADRLVKFGPFMKIEKVFHYFNKFYHDWELREVLVGIDETGESITQLGIEPIFKIAVKKLTPKVAQKLFLFYLGKKVEDLIFKVIPENHFMREFYGAFIPDKHTFADIIRDMTESAVNGGNVIETAVSSVQQRGMRAMMEASGEMAPGSEGIMNAVMSGNIDSIDENMLKDLAGGMAGKFAGEATGMHLDGHAMAGILKGDMNAAKDLGASIAGQKMGIDSSAIASIAKGEKLSHSQMQRLAEKMNSEMGGKNYGHMSVGDLASAAGGY